MVRIKKMQNRKNLSHFDLTGNIIHCCFEVMKELGPGFLESVYKNALYIVLREKELSVLTEQAFEVIFRKQKIGRYIVDLVVEDSVIIELKCCSNLLREHQAQLINYLKVTDIPVGLLVNFGNQKLEYRRLHHPANFINKDSYDPIPILLS